ncbi:hypothetical protein [Geothrix sp. 21YS21S-2]|uniref:hypothetical protein n=1 Tax=Geothrix sp. 21YS21S-2 TaxID=3068893 RepID=UPI0027B9179D|nr:hypothetical protein [Geothrix sp. 21YS21S-2]
MHEALQVSQALLDKRDSARLILGDSYREIMAEYGEVITAVSKDRGLNIIAATYQMIGESPDLESTGILYLVAAAVELIAPSPSEVANG